VIRRERKDAWYKRRIAVEKEKKKRRRKMEGGDQGQMGLSGERARGRTRETKKVLSSILLTIKKNGGYRMRNLLNGKR